MLKKIISTVKFLFSNEKKFYGMIKSITDVYPLNIEYYRLAFQHRSLMLKNEKGIQISNERLEFLGDAVLGETIAYDLFIKFPDKDEGHLTKIRSRIVNRNNLNNISLKIGLGKLIQAKPLSNIPFTHIPGDALEALIGAIYIDLGPKNARNFIRKKILSEQIDLDAIVDTDTNYKSLLIEWGQKYKHEIKFVTEEFSNHNLPERETFIAKVYAGETLLGEGKGGTKKEAHQHAAFNSIDLIRLKFPTLTLDKFDFL